MKRNYSNQEAKDIINAHQSLSNTINDSLTIISNIKDSIKNKTIELLNNKQFAKYVLKDCHDNMINTEIPAEIFKLLDKLYSLNQLSELSDEVYNLRKKYDAEISNQIKTLKSASSPLKWFFSSEEKKNNAILAYEYLKDQANGYFAHQVKGTNVALSQDSPRDPAKIVADFIKHKDEYLNLLNHAAPNMLASKSEIYEFKDMFAHYEQLNKIASNAKNSVKQLEGSVEKLSKRALTDQLIADLNEIPIEELRRFVSGLRYKTLHEHGFNTLADTYCASASNLYSIYGISDTMAYDIKKYTDEYVNGLKSVITLKLSTDNKTKSASNLVLVLYAIKTCQSLIKELDSLENKYKSDITNAFVKLQSLGNGTKWLFFDNEEKQKVIDTYTYLSDLLMNEYGEKVTSLTSRINNILNEPVPNVWNDFERNSVAYYNILESLVPDLLGKTDTWFGLPEELAKEIEDQCFFPEGLKCTLRRYQEWGVKYILHQERVLLGDEMGLGKTVQAIASMVSLRNTGATHFMVVCPASVVPNWCKEVAEKSKLRVTMIYGSDRLKALNAWRKSGGVAVTNYETTGHIKLNDNFKFDMLIVDEAHYIKNTEAQRTQNVLSISTHTKRLLFMTGTALENKVDEMLSLIKVLQPSVAEKAKNIAFLSSAPQFRERIAPVYYRRKREDVLTELPDLIETKEWCKMLPQEEKIYEDSVQHEHYMTVRRLSWNVPSLQHSSKARRMMEIIKEAESENRKIIVFSYFIETITKIQKHLGTRCLPPINGSISPQKRQEIINQFEKAPAGSVLLAQIQAGGTGLNIQSASVVIICEPQVKPSIENQAISRAYRMGQTRNVLVYRLLCEDSIDERMIEILSSKQEAFNAFADQSVSAAATNQQEIHLDSATMGEIIKEEIERIKEKQAKSSTKGE